jgi:predicted nucleic acid-binding protein
VKFLDANILVRYLTGDDPQKADASFHLLERVRSGDEDVMITEAVVAEIVYVLSSRAHYGLQAIEISDRLRPILGLRGIRLPGKPRCLRALELYGQPPFLGFEDSLIIAHMEAEQMTELYSYDRGFDRIREITRIEP